MLGSIIGGILLLVAFVFIELRVPSPMFDMRLFRIRAFSSGIFAGFLAAIGRGGLQFMLIIWLQGIWLPLHGYSYEATPLWAGIYMLPITIGFLIAGPISGALSDRFGSRAFATVGLLLVAATFVGLLLIPVNFEYWQFALLTGLNGIGSGLFSSPNRTAIMNSVPANERGAASGMAGVALNAGSSLSIGIFFSLMIAGLSVALPTALTNGLTVARRARRPSRRRSATPRRSAACSPRSSATTPSRACSGRPAILTAPHVDGGHPDGQGVLPAADLRALPRRSRRRLHRRRRS